MRKEDAIAMFTLAQTVLDNRDYINEEELKSLKYVYDNSRVNTQEYIANNSRGVRLEIERRIRR